MFQEVKTLNVSFKWKVKVRRITAGQETISWSQTKTFRLIVDLSNRAATQRALIGQQLLTVWSLANQTSSCCCSAGGTWVEPLIFCKMCTFVSHNHLWIKHRKKTGSLVAQISELTSCPADKQSVGAGETGSVRSATCHITASLQHQLMIKQREQRKHMAGWPVPHGRQNTCWGKVC